MTVQTTTSVPQWTLGDRMAKSLREAGIGVQEMAAYLGVARNTVATWTHDKIRPSRQTLLLWSLRTGVPLEWLELGEDPGRTDAPITHGYAPARCVTVTRKRERHGSRCTVSHPVGSLVATGVTGHGRLRRPPASPRTAARHDHRLHRLAAAAAR